MRILKYIFGPVYLLLGSLWGRLTQPRQMNRKGFLEPCPVDGEPCLYAAGATCSHHACPAWRAGHPKGQ